MRKPLHIPCVENSEGPTVDTRRTFTVGETAFPGVTNTTGHVLDRLKAQARRKRR